MTWGDNIKYKKSLVLQRRKNMILNPYSDAFIGFEGSDGLDKSYFYKKINDWLRLKRLPRRR